MVNGINIHYVIQGEGSPVMLLHGWPEFWYSWREQIPVLSERFQVIVPDMRGFGYSDKPASGYDTRTAASDMYELARHLGHEQVAIVAHDIGVRVAFRFVLDHEEAVQRLAFLDSTPPIEQLGPQEPAVVRERWHSYFHQQFDLPEKLIEGREEVYLRHIFRDWTINKYPPSPEEVAEYGAGLLPARRAAWRLQLLPRGGIPGPAGLARRRRPATAYAGAFPVRRATRPHRRGRRRGVLSARLGTKYSPTPSQRTWATTATSCNGNAPMR